jgi:hypothetical protein
VTASAGLIRAVTAIGAGATGGASFPATGELGSLVGTVGTGRSPEGALAARGDEPSLGDEPARGDDPSCGDEGARGGGAAGSGGATGSGGGGGNPGGLARSGVVSGAADGTSLHPCSVSARSGLVACGPDGASAPAPEAGFPSVAMGYRRRLRRAVA